MQIRLQISLHIQEERREKVKKIREVQDFFMCAREEQPIYLPNIEKKIINPAEIWITLRLPTRVLPRSPTFSLSIIIRNKAQIFNPPMGERKQDDHIKVCFAYTDTVHPVAVPKSPLSKMPIPYRKNKRHKDLLVYQESIYRSEFSIL